MNEQLADRARVRELILRCLDGDATDAETAELEALAIRDPSVAREVAYAAQIESALEVTTRAQPVVRPADIRTARRRRTIWIAMPAAALAAAGMLLAWSLRENIGAVSPVASDPKVVPTAAVVPPPQPTTVKPFSPDRRVYFADGSFADLRDARSRLEARVASPTAVDVVLEAGGARFEVAKRPGRRFRVWVAASYVEVIGTIFTVDRSQDGVRVSVERGVVNVVSGQKKIRVSAGSSDSISVATPSAHMRRRSGTPLPSAPPQDEPGAWLLASETARRNGRPQEALAILGRLLERHGNDPRAPYASFIMGRVLLEELRRPRDAAAAFARVAMIDVNTPLAQDALAREVESWSRAGDKQRARERAAAYVERYPAGARVEEVRRYSSE
jgi:ferric-dicitrate binding protein FerR (iron transport regulator)